MNKRVTSVSDFDWWTIVCYLFLAIAGCVMIYAANYEPETPKAIFNLSTRGGKQILYLGVSLLTGLGITLLNPQIFKTLAYVLYGVCILLLIGVMVYGAATNGAMSWFHLPGGIKFQPSEISKFATAILLATYLSSSDTSITQFPKNLIVSGIFLLPSLLVVLQGDPGSALVFMAFLIPLFREGFYTWVYILMIALIVLFISSLMYDIVLVATVLLLIGGLFTISTLKFRNYWLVAYLGFIVASIFLYKDYAQYILIGNTIFFITTFLANIFIGKRELLPIILVSVIVAIGFSFSVNYLFYNVLKPHQQDRINVWLMPEKADKRGSYYNLRQSKLAIGSGGITGKGLLQGEMTQGNHVPEQDTDFIFTVVGEEWGFLGTIVIVSIYLFLLIRLSIIAERQRSRFTRIYAYGIAGIISLHLLINIGMTLGLMPVIGIPLPLMSYGGSSLLSFTIMLAVLLRFDSQRLLVFR